MSRHVTFETLWLVSERDMKGRCQILNEKRILLYGKNGTGKSRIIKNLFWALGCDPPKREQGLWDPDTVAALEFKFGEDRYLVIRQGKRLGLFDSSGVLLFAAENMAAWDARISSLFGFQLKLQRPNSTNFSQAGMEYLTLPFYMDQDGSWGKDWDTFTQLGQFTKWKSEVFEAFVGLRPNAYFEAKRKRDEIRGRLSTKQNELEAQRNAFARVREVLPRKLPSLDVSSFRKELTEVGRRVLSAQREQISLRAKLSLLVSQKERIHTELQLASSAHRELVSDLVYLTDVPEKVLECPTCGTQHEKSFHARLQLTQDADSLAALVAELNVQYTKAREEESRLRGDLRGMERSLKELDVTLEDRKAHLRLDEVMSAHSKKTLDVAFNKVSESISSELSRLTEEEVKLNAQVKRFTDKNRIRIVSEYYGAQVTSISGSLNIPGSEQVPDLKPGSRGNSGGSSYPRSLLAVHLAMLRSNVEYGDTPQFPFVVDTPQQSGQDPTNLKSMIEILSRSAGMEHQVILAVEHLPVDVDVSAFSIVNFAEEGGALNRGEYLRVVQKLKAPLTSMQSAIRKDLEARKSG